MKMNRIIVISVFFGFLLIMSGCVYDVPTEPDDTSSYTLSNVDIVQNIVEEHYSTHTYSLVDFYVCTDSSIDVWNQVKTKGINAKICVGNIDEDISNYETNFEYFNHINHAWVLAETKPFTWVALETTGGYLVWGNNKSGGIGIENELYYEGFCFDNPKEFKKFVDLRTDLLDVCPESERLINYWNEHIVGQPVSEKNSELKGQLEAKQEECNSIINQMRGLLS